MTEEQDYERANRQLGAAFGAAIPGLVVRWIVIAETIEEHGRAAFVGCPNDSTDWDDTTLLGHATSRPHTPVDCPEVVDKVSDALASAIPHLSGESSMVTKWVLVCEIMTADADIPKYEFRVYASPHLPPWDVHGLPLFALHQTMAQGVAEHLPDGCE